MAWCEAIIAFDVAIQAEIDALEVLAPTSLTTRTGYGKPKVTHFAAFVSNDNVARVYCVPSGYADANGFTAPLVNIYGAASLCDMEKSRLPVPIEVPENTLMTIYAQSETAADSVVFAWMLLEYPGKGNFVDCPGSGAMTQRAWEAGAALASNVAANSTDLNTLQAGRRYWVSGVGKAAVNGETAGCVGPAFIKFRNSEFEGAEFWIPLINNGGYAANGIGGADFVDFKACGIKSCIVAGGTPFQTACVGYTVEQPQAVIAYVVDKLFA